MLGIIRKDDSSEYDEEVYVIYYFFLLFSLLTCISTGFDMYYF